MRTNFMLLITVLLLYPALSSAQVYKYTDKNGAVAFTDNIENVPEPQRPQIQKIESSSSPVIPQLVSSRTHYDRWIDHPLAKYVLAFIILSAVMLYAQHKTESFLLKLAMKLLFVGCLGAAIYSVLVMQDQPITPAALQKAAEPYLPTPEPINRARDAVNKIQESQKKEEAAIEALLNGNDPNK